MNIADERVLQPTIKLEVDLAAEFTEYIDSLVRKVLESPGYAETSPDQQRSLESKLRPHFEQLFIETALNRMTEAQIEEIQSLVETDPEQATVRLEQIASTIPSLASDIEHRLEGEVRRLQKLAET